MGRVCPRTVGVLFERGENAHLAVPTISAASAAAAAEFPLEGRKHAQKPVVSLGQAQARRRRPR